jgi:hypothetical protein
VNRGRRRRSVGDVAFRDDLSRGRPGQQLVSLSPTLAHLPILPALRAAAGATIEIFDGFDHTRYEDEVVERWGRAAYEQGERWWSSLSADADLDVLCVHGW